jgi:phosphopantothenoylcysteine decarboxylase/phosphopantothenate--cysteine ligase
MMSKPLDGKNVVLGVTGSIACYKAADLASKLVQSGATVKVILSHSATKFISPLTFNGITHQPVITDLFEEESSLGIGHITLANQADILVVAPSTANLIAKLAHGMADDALTTTALATTAPLLLAPAMDGNMYHNSAFQMNLKSVRKLGMYVVGPVKGRLASGIAGYGRMAEIPELLENILWIVGKDGDLQGRKIVVTAGGTQEPIDPVRFIGNRSSGKMGYAVAIAARNRGANVVLVSAPTNLPKPAGIALTNVTTSREMFVAVLAASDQADAVIMAAAPADFRPSIVSKDKVKKTMTQWDLRLERTDDILSQINGDVMKVGFAAETSNMIKYAKSKLREKRAHLFVANDVTDPDSGFGKDTNRVTLLDSDGGQEQLPLLEKHDVANHILDRLVKFLQVPN